MHLYDMCMGLQALCDAGLQASELDVICFTKGPGACELLLLLLLLLSAAAIM